MRRILLRLLRPRSPHVVRVLAVLFVLLARRPAHATTYDVDRTDDDASKTACTAAANDCTLRGAIIASNLHAGADVITLPANTYTLTIGGSGEDAAATGDLDISDDLTITGVGSASTIIDATGLGDRVIQTDPTGAGTITVSISGVTIQHGNSAAISGKNAEGGGIRNGGTSLAVAQSAGTLHLVDVVVDSNTCEKAGGGISNDGVMTIVNSVVSNNTTSSGSNGGGIIQDDDGSLSISGTTIDGNNAVAGGGGGGGLWVGFFSTTDTPAVTIDKSTFSNNQAKTGGAIFRNRGSMTVTNSTISGNTSTQASSFGGGGVYDSGGFLTSMLLADCTITNNTSAGVSTGGGIQNNGILAGSLETKLVNTLVANNLGGSEPDVAGGILSAGYNLFGNTTGLSIDPASVTTGDIMGASVVSLHLGALAANGGLTKTHALGVGSVALDAANPAAPGSGGTACPSTDQRGDARAVDGDGSGTARCDIGAFESQVVPATPTPTITPSATKTATPTSTATATKTATPVPSVTATPATTEICDNCVDDDGDGLVDRDDPNCDQPLDGGAQGLGDVTRAKHLVKCAGAIEKAGAKLEGKHLARFQKCFAAAFTCVELKNGDSKCGAKARATCDKAFAAIPGDAREARSGAREGLRRVSSSIRTIWSARPGSATADTRSAARASELPRPSTRRASVRASRSSRHAAPMRCSARRSRVPASSWHSSAARPARCRVCQRVPGPASVSATRSVARPRSSASRRSKRRAPSS